MAHDIEFNLDNFEWLPGSPKEHVTLLQVDRQYGEFLVLVKVEIMPIGESSKGVMAAEDPVAFVKIRTYRSVRWEA